MTRRFCTGTASCNAGLPPGGHIEPNEDPVQAVLREVAEETGVEAEVVPTGGVGTAIWSTPRRSLPPLTIMVEDIDDPVQGFHQHIDFIYVCQPQSSHVRGRARRVALGDARRARRGRHFCTRRRRTKARRRPTERSPAGRQGLLRTTRAPLRVKGGLSRVKALILAPFSPRNDLDRLRRRMTVSLRAVDGELCMLWDPAESGPPAWPMSQIEAVVTEIDYPSSTRCSMTPHRCVSSGCAGTATHAG